MVHCGVVKWLGCECVSLTPKRKVIQQGRCVQERVLVGDVVGHRSRAGSEAVGGGVETEVGKRGGALLDFARDQGRGRK